MAQGHLQVTAIANPKDLTFKDLSVGEKFYFPMNPEAFRHYDDGPYRKTSARGYRIADLDDPDAGLDYKVGTISVKVKRAASVTGHENPAFGKRKTGTPKTAKKKSAPKFGRKKVAGRANPKPPTLKDLKLEAAALGMSVTKNEDGEFRVAFKNNREASAYYTDDAEDALGTMRAMHRDKKSATVTGNKNPTPRASAYIVRGMRRGSKVTVSPMYFTGYGFDTDKTKAVRFMTSKIAQHALEKVEETFPKVAAILNMDVIQA